MKEQIPSVQDQNETYNRASSIEPDQFDAARPELPPGTPETETERRSFRGLVGIGLAAGSLFLGACTKNGVEHPDPKAEILVTCDVSDSSNLPRAEVSLEGGDYGAGGSVHRTITRGDNVVHIDSFQAFNISCIERRPDGVIISQEIPSLDIGVPGDPFRESLQFWQIDSAPGIKAEVAETRKVKYVLTVRPNAQSADGFSISSLNLVQSPWYPNGHGTMTADDRAVSVDLRWLDEPNSVRLDSVTISDGPGLGQFGFGAMYDGDEVASS
jgi:hypothetical protein